MKRASGFTIIELIVAVAIAAILLGLGAPSMRTYLENQKVTAVMNTISSGINLARSTAVESRQPVGVCSTTNGTTCAGVADWDRGWMVWVDSDQSGDFTAGVDEIVRVDVNQESNMTVTANINRLVYSPSGLLTPMPGAVESITICKADATYQGVVTVLPSGQVNSKRETSAC